MKIVHIGHVPIPPDHPDYGRLSVHPGRWVLNHAQAQARHTDLQVEVVTIVHRSSCDFITEVEGVRVHFMRTWHPWRAETRFLLDRKRISHYVRRLKPDLVHAHGTEDANSLIAQEGGCPSVITVQGLMFQIMPRLQHVPRPMRFAARTEHLALTRAKTVIAKSEYVRDELAKAFPHLGLHLIPNTYQAELDADLQERTGRQLAYVGSLDERKGIHLIADAMPAVKAAVPDVVFNIIGNTPIMSDYAQEQINRLREILEDRLILWGRKPALELFDILRPCTALLAPSLEEMFGNQLIEALMCGLHGIVPEETALAENARRFGNSTIIPQKDSSALTTAAIKALQSPPPNSDRETARNNIRNHMGPKAIAQKHNKLYINIRYTSPNSSLKELKIC